MHIALRITEITTMAFGSLEQADLARCARVCRHWFIPAVEILWGTTQFWSGLILGLLVKKGLMQQIDSSTFWEFAKEPSRHDWERLYLYASRIQHLKFKAGNGSPECLTQEAMNRLFRPSKFGAEDVVLFPSLTRLYLSISQPGDVHLCRKLIPHHPRLNSLSVDLSSTLRFHDKEDIEGLWPSFIPISHNLLNIQISFNGEPLDASDKHQWKSLCSILPFCTSLESFIGATHSRPMTPEVIHILSLLPNLKRLEGCFVHPPGSYVTHPSTSLHTFPSLNALSLWPIGAVFHQDWFPPINLERLHACPVGPDSFQFIVRRLISRAQSVHTLQLNVCGSIPHIETLGELHQLRSLTISIWYGAMIIKDDDIKHLAVGLPELRLISLSYNAQSHSHLPSLLAIHFLVSFCPKITSIALKFDATRIPLMPSSLFATQPESSSLFLNTFCSPLRNPVAVAGWLERCCSRFSDVYVSPPESWASSDVFEWRTVGRLLSEALASRS